MERIEPAQVGELRRLDKAGDSIRRPEIVLGLPVVYACPDPRPNFVSGFRGPTSCRVTRPFPRNGKHETRATPDTATRFPAGQDRALASSQQAELFTAIGSLPAPWGRWSRPPEHAAAETPPAVP